MQITTRDNNAILHQLMTTMEERINLKISNLRSEMIELIEKNTGNTVAPMQIPRPQSPLKGPARRASAFEMKSNPSQQVTVAPLKAEDIYDMVSITPHPGFVIKTRKLIGEKNKVFINVFHHELIALNPPGLPSEKAIDKPYMMMEEPTTAVDHSGAKCMTFNVGISSEYFTQPNPLVDINITAPVTIYKVRRFSVLLFCAYCA